MGATPIHTIFDGTALAGEVLARYDVGEVRECSLWASSLNDTYLVRAEGNYALRVYRHGWRDEGDVAFEMAALRHLTRKGSAVAEPITDRSGSVSSVLDAPEGPRHVALFRWAPGAPGVPEASFAREYGRAMAALHTASDDFDPSPRQRFDLEAITTRPAAVITHALDQRVEDAQFVDALAVRLHAELAERAPDLDWGFCHGDLHGGNAHVDDGRFTFFDFDCAGAGWRAYDIAVYAWSTRAMRTDASGEAGWTDLLSGYREMRSLADEDLRTIPWFVAARHLWYMALHAGLLPGIGKQWLSEQALDGHMRILRTLHERHLAPRSP